MWLASAARGESSFEPKTAAPIRLSAPPMPSGLRVNCTAEASARYSRCRDAAALMRLPKNKPDKAEHHEHQADQQQVHAPLSLLRELRPPPQAGDPQHLAADQAQQQDAVEDADQPEVEPHVAVEDVAELVGDDALQLVARELLGAAARDADDGVARRDSRRQRR